MFVFINSLFIFTNSLFIFVNGTINESYVFQSYVFRGVIIIM